VVEANTSRLTTFSTRKLLLLVFVFFISIRYALLAFFWLASVAERGSRVASMEF